MEGNEFLTIYEASKLTGKSITTIHRYIKKGLLHVKTGYNGGKQVITIEKSELERFLNTDGKTGYNTLKQEVKPCYNSDITDVITRQNLKETFQEFLEEQKTQLMKPIEDQALYQLGRMEQENTFLKAKVETLLQENQELQEKIKALPDLQTIQEKEKDLITQIELERQEKEEQKARHLSDIEEQKRNMDELYRRELEQTKQEKDSALTALKSQIANIQKEKEALTAQTEKEKTEAEEREKQMAEAWRKELEEARRPWWKKLFS